MIKDEKRNMLNLHIACPLCGMRLIDLAHGEFYESGKDLNIHDYWCNECNIDITIDDNMEDEEEEQEQQEEL